MAMLFGQTIEGLKGAGVVMMLGVVPGNLVLVRHEEGANEVRAAEHDPGVQRVPTQSRRVAGTVYARRQDHSNVG